MRTIKFRGKTIKGGRWIVGDLLRTPGYSGDGVAIQYWDEEDGWMCEDVRIATVGQFTGLHDKNGEEIYEGDIIYLEFSDGSHGNCLVGWNEEKACFGIMDEYAYRSKQEGYDYAKFDCYLLFNVRKEDGTRFEVIGNIHDNPELLNKKQ